MQQQHFLDRVRAHHAWRPWFAAAALMGAAALARYFLIQPPEVAHQCDQGAGPAWCIARQAIIMTYSGYGLGYASLAALALALWRPAVVTGALALACGGAALILYCYEPGAVAFAAGALVLARAQREPAAVLQA